MGGFGFRLRGYAGGLALIYGLVGLVLRCGWADRSRFTAMPFYATPWPLVALAFFLAGVWLRRGRVVWLSAGLLVCGVWLALDYRVQQPHVSHAEVGGDRTRVLFWNVNRPRQHPKQTLLELIAELDPHVVAMVEMEDPGPREIASYRDELPGWQVLSLPRSMACFSRVPVKFIELAWLGDGSFANQVQLTFPEGPVSLWIADIHASPRRERWGPLGELFKRSSRDAATLVVGDFNTPQDSAALDEWQAHFTNAWDEAGSGFRQSWPYGLPILSLDQLWVGPSFHVLRQRSGYSLWRGSDHAWQVMDVVWKNEN